MPETMKQLAWVQFATWLGLFCMFLYFSVAVAHNVFGATDPHSALYTEGIAWAGYCAAAYSGGVLRVVVRAAADGQSVGPEDDPQLVLIVRGGGTDFGGSDP